MCVSECDRGSLGPLRLLNHETKKKKEEEKENEKEKKKTREKTEILPLFESRTLFTLN